MIRPQRNFEILGEQNRKERFNSSCYNPWVRNSYTGIRLMSSHTDRAFSPQVLMIVSLPLKQSRVSRHIVLSSPY